MKHVLLTFFGLIFLYSLTFNGKENVKPEKKMDFLYEKSFPDVYLMPDSSFNKTNFATHYEAMLSVSKFRY